jgi:hypothetical protein
MRSGHDSDDLKSIETSVVLDGGSRSASGGTILVGHDDGKAAADELAEDAEADEDVALEPLSSEVCVDDVVLGFWSSNED